MEAWARAEGKTVRECDDEMISIYDGNVAGALARARVPYLTDCTSDCEHCGGYCYTQRYSFAWSQIRRSTSPFWQMFLLREKVALQQLVLQVINRTPNDYSCNFYRKLLLCDRLPAQPDALRESSVCC